MGPEFCVPRAPLSNPRLAREMFETWGLAAPLVFRVATDKGRHGYLGFDRAPQGSWLRADSTFADPRKHGAPCCFP